MAIQAEFYPSSNDNIMLSPLFCNNGGYNFADDDGFVESCFNSQQKQHHHHIQQKQQQQQLERRLQQLCDESQRPIIDPNVLVFNPKFNNSNNNNLHHHSSNSYTPSFGFQNQFEMQREQIDQQIDEYIILQNAKLRHMIEELGKQQVAALLRKVECRSLCMLREKDQEIAQATKKRLELEEYLRRLEAENEAWQRMAQENEAIALSLHKTLEDMRERGVSFGAVDANDAESCCDESNEEEEEDEIGENNENWVCKSCNYGKSCCLFLPCRHLSSCKVCDAFLQACPVCRMPKKASLEIKL